MATLMPCNIKIYTHVYAYIYAHGAKKSTPTRTSTPMLALNNIKSMHIYSYIYASVRKVHVSAYAYTCNTKSTSAHAPTHMCTPANATHVYAYACAYESTYVYAYACAYNIRIYVRLRFHLRIQRPHTYVYAFIQIYT